MYLLSAQTSMCVQTTSQCQELLQTNQHSIDSNLSDQAAVDYRIKSCHCVPLMGPACRSHAIETTTPIEDNPVLFNLIDQYFSPDRSWTDSAAIPLNSKPSRQHLQKLTPFKSEVDAPPKTWTRIHKVHKILVHE